MWEWGVLMKRGRRWIYVLGSLATIGVCVGLLFVWHADNHNSSSTQINRSAKSQSSRKAPKSRADKKVVVTRLSPEEKDGQKGFLTTGDITDYLKRGHFVGSALIIKNGRFLYRKAFGYANYADRLKNKTNSEFQILSIQKSLTAACIMKLIQEKRLTLTTSLARFYPTIAHANHILIRNMLDMDSGLSMTDTGSKRPLREKQVVEYAVKHVLSNPAAYGKWRYQPVNYVLLAGIIARLSEKSYRRYFDQLFIRPFDLKGTGFVQTQPLTPYKTIGYRYKRASQVIQNYQKPFHETRAAMQNELGTGQVYMTAYALFKVESRLLQGKIISIKNVRTLHTAGTSSTYGGGVYNQPNGIRSHGIGYGYESCVLESRNGKNGVVLLSNYYRPAASIQKLAVPLFDQMMSGKLG